MRFATPRLWLIRRLAGRYTVLVNAYAPDTPPNLRYADADQR